jgi:hypothetical protein
LFYFLIIVFTSANKLTQNVADLNVATMAQPRRMNLWVQLQAQSNNAFALPTAVYQQLSDLDQRWLLDQFS